MQSDRPIAITITPGTIITTILIIAATFVLFALKNIVLVVLISIVIASAIEPAVKFFSRLKVPRVVSVLAMYVGLVALLISFFYFFLPPLLLETSGFLATIPRFIDSLTLTDPLSGDALLQPTTSQNFLESLRELQATFSTTTTGLFNAVSTVFGGVLSFVLVMVLSFYFAVQEKGIDDFLTLVTPKKHQAYVLDLWGRSQMKIGRWMQGQIILSCIIAILVWIGLTVMGVEYALLLAILAGGLELIPVFGSILAAVPAVIVAFIGGGTSLALLVVAYYIIVNQVQGNFVYPKVVQKVLGVPPLLVILSLIVGGQLAGFLGIILAVPIAAILRELVNDLQKDRQEQDQKPSLEQLTL